MKRHSHVSLFPQKQTDYDNEEVYRIRAPEGISQAQIRKLITALMDRHRAPSRLMTDYHSRVDVD